MSRVRIAVLLVAAGIAVTSQAPATTGDRLSSCDAETRERLSFLEARLKADRGHAWWWTRGWLGVHSFGLVYQSALGATEDDDGRQADAVTNAIKAAIGVTELVLSRPSARHGADVIREEAPLADEAACRRAVSRGEEQLRRNAREATMFRQWTLHLANVALNLAGALVVAEGWDEPGRAALSGGLGVTVGTIQLWTRPSRALGALQEYERRFERERIARDPGWSVAVFLVERGAAVRITF